MLLRNGLLVLRSVPTLGSVGAMKLAAAFLGWSSPALRPKPLRHELKVRAGTSDPAVLATVFARRDYIAPADPEISLILDLAANVGYSAAFFAHHYPGAAVIALEPQDTNYALLVSNALPWENIRAFKMGAWWRASQVEPIDSGASSWGFRFQETQTGGVPCVSVGQLIDEHYKSGKILVKMDIEGAEADIFSKDPSWLSRIDYLQIEIHDCWKKVFDALFQFRYSAKANGSTICIEFDRT